MRLRGYGNAVVAPVAIAFIEAVIDVIQEKVQHGRASLVDAAEDGQEVGSL
jgi:hypothetical protein